MTDTNLTTINQDELNAFLSQHKVSQEDLNGGGDFLPALRVNYMDEVTIDGKTYELKPGTFTITVGDVTVYAKNAKFRPLLQNYQYIDFDKDKEEVVNRSIIFNDFSEEARDEKGTVRCGKPQSKVLKDNPALKKAWEHVNLYRSVDGLTTIEGVDVYGKPVKFENVLSTFRGKGTNFSPFQEEYTKLLPKGSMLWDYELVLSTTKHKQDPKSAVNYFIVHFEADFAKKLQFTVEEFDLVKSLARRVEDTNKEIDKKYYTVLSGNKDAELMDAIDITPNESSLDADFDGDDNPF